MKKYIILAILFATTFINDGRDDPSKTFFFFGDDTTGTSWEGSLKGDLYYTNLNGTTQYWSKTSPVGLDLNGAEMVTKDSNSTFESGDTTDWRSNGTHSIDTSSTYKYAGSYSGKVISTGVGDTTTNFISLAYTQFGQIEAGKKYTVEYWANAVGSQGANIIPDSNSSFTAYGLSYWTTYQSTFSRNDSGWISITSTANDNTGMSRTANLTSGASYSVFFRAKSITTTAKVTSIGDFSNVFYSVSNPSLSSNWQTYSFIIKPNQANLRIYFGTVAIGNMIDVDSIIVKAITLPTLTAKIGSKSWTSDTLSIIPGVFEKVVYNFQATSSEVNTPIKIYCSQAGTGWIDNFSIREAYDFSKWAWIKSSATGTNKMIAERFASNNGLKLSINTSNQLVAVVGDGTNTVTKTGTATNLCNGSWHLVGLTASRTGNLQLYVDGVADGTATAITSLGSIVSTTAFQIGFLSADYFNGSIGEIQRIRHTDLALVDKTPAQIYARGYNSVNMYSSYTGSTIVGWWFKTQDGADASGNGNTVTSNGSATVSVKTGGYR